MAAALLAGLTLSSRKPDVSDASAVPLDVALTICEGPDRDTCFAEWVVVRAEVRGTRPALSDLTELLEVNADARKLCHSLAHEVGIAMYDRFGWDAVFGGVDWCNWGYYHGLLQGAARSDMSDLQETGFRICAQVSPTGVADFQCLHGIGHAAYRASGDLRSALSSCSGMDGQDAYVCTNGVVMEAFMQEATAHFVAQNFTPVDCVSLGSSFLVAGCAQAMAGVMYESGSTLTAACSDFQDPSIREVCVEGYGQHLASKATDTTPVPESMAGPCMASAPCAYWTGRTIYDILYDLKAAQQLCQRLAGKADPESCLDGVEYSRSKDRTTGPVTDTPSD